MRLNQAILIDHPAADAYVFYVATCQHCKPVLPMPFGNRGFRDIWVREHASIGHEDIHLFTEIRTSTEEE